MMKASSFEYRFRYLLHFFIFLLGFWVPWNYWLHLDPAGPNAHVWGLLAENLMQAGMNISAAFNVILMAAIVLALAGAWLRTWGSAYLGAEVVQSQAMHTAAASAAGSATSSPETGILQDGPFRFVRNPLYLGTFLHTLALSVLMQRSGAIFTIVMIGMLQVRLILAEEAFLGAKLGAAYAAYCGLVPRLLPALRARVVARGLTPRWVQAVLGESYFWGVAGSFAVAGWSYNEMLLVRCVLVSVGVALVLRALGPAGLGVQPEFPAG